jgi:predicted TIM-barrel fold metal-dependent hydrolase
MKKEYYIDAHAHVLMNPRIPYNRKARPFISAEEQIAIMDRKGISKAVILPLSNPEILPEYQGLDEVLRICACFPGRFIPFANVDPRLTGTLLDVDADHFTFILEHYREAGCRGLGELAAKIFWDDPRLLNLLAACERVGFPVTFHTSMPESKDYGVVDDIGFPRFESVLQRFPSLVFLAHSQGWWSEISGSVTPGEKCGYPRGPVAPGGSVVRLMRKYPQLWGDISANSGLKALQRDLEFTSGFVDEFQDRLVLGLDTCQITDDRQHTDWLRQCRDSGLITQAVFEKICWRNLARLLKIAESDLAAINLGDKHL